ncbi:hypothetical protein LXL04_013658 [Taraxacum kok-saghyz]
MSPESMEKSRRWEEKKIGGPWRSLQRLRCSDEFHTDPAQALAATPIAATGAIAATSWDVAAIAPVAAIGVAANACISCSVVYKYMRLESPYYAIQVQKKTSGEFFLRNLTIAIAEKGLRCKLSSRRRYGDHVEEGSAKDN